MFNPELISQMVMMIEEAVACETKFAEDLLSGGVAGMTPLDMSQHLEFVADQR